MMIHRDIRNIGPIRIAIATLTGAVLIGTALSVAAQQRDSRAPRETVASQPVPGHVPDQKEQAQKAPVTGVANDDYAQTDQWWSPGQGGTLGAMQEFENEHGRLGIVNTSGAIETKGHPLFEPLGENGRACVTCHQPADGMSLSAATVQLRWEATQGKDPLFAAIDGSNCPHLPQQEKASHSLLLERGLIRIFLPWPPKDSQGKAIDPEFTLEVVEDPTGCNTHPQYGVKSATPMVSVYRRPRVMANMKYVISGGGLFNIKDGSLMSKDPETGRPVSMQLMADARQPTLKTQAVEAAITHLQFNGALSDAQLKAINTFQNQIYLAQISHRKAGDLVGNGATGLGPQAMVDGSFGLGDNFATPVFGKFDAWRTAQAGETKEQQEFRASVARGSDVFLVRPFWIRDVTHLNTVGLGNPIKRTCATCHNSRMVGMDLAPGWMDLGTTNMPWARTANNIASVRSPWSHAFDEHAEHEGSNHEPARPKDHTKDLPLFKLTCKDSALPHPFLGRVIYTQDPGRGLINGRCRDIGAITMQQMRGLAARAPYFSNGSARTLEELVEYYDQRFNVQYSEQEKRDLVNFLSVL
jgi:hypothetical protein